MNLYFSLWLSNFKRLKVSWLCSMATLTLLLCTPAHGLSVVSRSFDELVQRADLILVGTVSEVHSEFADDGLDQNSIVSYVNFNDLRAVKGQVNGEPYVLRVPGGVVGRFAQDYPGVPAFQTGQRYLVFIRGNRHDFFPVVGISQGVFRILSNAQGQQVVVREDHVGHASQRALTTLTQDAPTLDKFIQDIRARLTPAATVPGSNLP
jgi:hypothetical protein